MYYAKHNTKEKFGVVRLKNTRHDKSKGTRIGPSPHYFKHQNYTSNISNNYSITILFPPNLNYHL